MRPASLSLLLVATGLAAADTKLDFNRDIRPILSDNCFACHGFDAKKRKGKLRLDTAEGATAIKDGIQAVKPGDPEASELIKRILSKDPEEVMPPPESHKQITPAQVDILRRWIAQGAAYRKHWSFEVPVRPEIPAAPKGTSPIDAFLGDEITKQGLTAGPEADPERLIRRATLDLTGLPPTPSEIDAFLKDTAPGAYERVVDRLMGSPRYGEHMARGWLDAARYADTHGLHLDNERSMWPYRDWVVKAFNDNLPFDRFTTWQLAGDLQPDATREQRIASGFNRCNVTTSEGGSINDELLFRYAVDRTETTMGVWMGLTAGCAVCHDHKFDPVTTKEFYSLYSFFYSAADPGFDGNILLTPPVLMLATPEQEKSLKDFDAKIAAHQKAVRDAIASLQYVDPATLTPPPPVRTGETVWFEDAFPEKAKVNGTGGATTFVEAGQGPVHSGKRALKRTAKGVAQDFFENGASFDIPPNGVISVWVYLEPNDLPKSIMVQFHVGGWNHRAYWGEEGAIPFGRVRTPEKVNAGKLPEAGKWTQLKVDIAKLGLKPGMKIDGFAFTQFDGTVYWDRLAISHRIEEAKDVQWSFKFWSEKKQGSRVAELTGDLQNLVRGKKAAQWTDAERKRLLDWWLENEFQGGKEKLDGLRAAKLAEESRKKALNDLIPATLVMADLPQPRQAHVMIRGQYDKPGDAVSRGVPAAFHPLPKKEAYDRRDLAEWLLSPANPLTARVTVNRFWQQFFGLGLVKTSGDFGSQSEPPSHPELLDWLAVDFRERGWDMKRLVRSIVTSAAYRRSAAASAELLAKDPENRFLARGPRARLDAEVIRDQALFVSGLLNPRMGGKGVKPYQPDNVWEPVGFTGSNTARYVRDSGEALYRRSLYTFWKRTAPPPSMSTFDAPAREASCVRRERSNTPLQALALMNDVQHVEAARAFAQRILKEGGADDAARLAFAWRTAVGRRPKADEASATQEALTAHRARYASAPEDATKLITFGDSKPDPALPAPELAAWTLTAGLLLNLDETLNR
jgi:mono/diheme cytochrome c family protein